MTQRGLTLTSAPQRVAIVRALPGLGDLLCAVPAFRSLRSTWPQAHLTLIGLPWAEQFVQRFRHYLDDWLEFPGYPGIPEVPSSPQRLRSFLDRAESRFDLVMQLHGNGCVMNRFVQRLQAQAVGFCPQDQPCPEGDRFLPYPENESEIWRQLRLLEFLGVPLHGDHLEFPLARSDWQEFEAIAASQRLKHYVCLHPGASVDDRRWSPQQFAIVADALAAQGWQIVLTGTASEAKLTETVAESMQCPAIDLAGQTHLGGLAALLQQSRLLICNDTGVSHLAAALQVNSVVIFSQSDPQRWAPLDRQRHRALIRPTASQVLATAIDLLQPEVAYAS